MTFFARILRNRAMISGLGVSSRLAINKQERLSRSCLSCCKSHENFQSNKCQKYGASLAFLGWLFKSKEEEEDEETKLITMIKRSILLIQREEYGKAERMLHLALRQAQTLQNVDGITYIYDVMANLAFDNGDYKKAEKLFVTVMQRELARGTKQEDIKMIHMSLKLAKIMEENKEIQKAITGYNFCLDALKKNYNDDESKNEDVLLIWQTTYDWLAKLLFSLSKYKDARDCLSEALNISLKLNGEEHETTALLLNDLGTAMFFLGQEIQAFEHLTKAAEIVKKLPPPVECAPTVFVNLGNLFIQRGLYDEAKNYCKDAWKECKKNNDQDTMKEAEECLDKITKFFSDVKE